MSFDPLRKHPRARKVAPWLVWGAVLAGVFVFGRQAGSIGMVPASAEVRKATVTAPRTARVVSVKVQPGEAVLAGQELVVLDPGGIDLEIAVARAELKAHVLDARGSDLESSARLAQEAERAAVDLAAVVSEEKRDRAELAQLDELIAKQDKLIEQRLASAEQRDELKLQRSSVAQRVAEYAGLLRAAREHESAARARLTAWRAARAQSPTSSTPADAGTAPALASAGVTAEEERVRLLESARASLVLKAPIAGRVSEIFVSNGDTPQVDAPVVVIVDDHPLRVVAWVDQTRVARIEIGERVVLRSSSGGEPDRTGIVRQFAPSVAEIPMRFWPMPSQPVFGRAVYISISATGEGEEPPLPGQAFDAIFTGERE